MITITCKNGIQFNYVGNIIVFQNDYGMVQVLWDEIVQNNDEELLIWKSNGMDWFYSEELESIKGK